MKQSFKWNQPRVIAIRVHRVDEDNSFASHCSPSRSISGKPLLPAGWNILGFFTQCKMKSPKEHTRSMQCKCYTQKLPSGKEITAPLGKILQHELACCYYMDQAAQVSSTKTRLQNHYHFEIAGHRITSDSTQGFMGLVLCYLQVLNKTLNI